MRSIGTIIDAMIEYYGTDAGRIQHFLKVYAFAKAIGEREGLDPKTQELLEAAAVVHDIGIKVSEEKYHSSAGSYQQLEGPPVAKDMLTELGYEDSFTQRVCYLVGHHHTYTNIEGLDYQILVEADFLVNIYEDGMGKKEVESIRSKIFRTQAGIRFLDLMF